MAPQRWFIMAQLEDSLSAQKGLGFSDKDIDDVRRMLSDTSIYFLLVTIIASLLHLIFEFLAFQSDINFWQHNKSLAGLSTRTVITDLISQCVVFLFLLDSDTSLLVTIPSFIAILIQIWKVRKATGITLKFGGWTLIGLEFQRWKEVSEDKEVKIGSNDDKTVTDREETEEKLAKVTLEADRFAMRYLGGILSPLVIGFIIKSLVYEKHLSWYSWAIGSLTGSVYAFGFVFMCPQLYINHQLKSVSHLPWQVLISITLALYAC